ncbi:hypothetical protein HOF65_02495 [bacterium]|nr:hypothetical protein [bacterium]MBT3852870.1 hypothetical protein [bacterium]MBT4632851.1 hypothetical protein [bacterium]MBT6778669.1 hypothetical protein [bacterium]
MFIASVIQSLYKIIISFSSNFISCSLSSFEISLIIHKATQPDFILNVFCCLCLYIIKYSCHAHVINILFSFSSHLTSNRLISRFAFTLGFSISLVFAKIFAQLVKTFVNQLIKAFTIIIINQAQTQ